MVDTLKEHDIELAASWLAGKDNELADQLSRWKREFDDQDWRLSRKEFLALQKQLGHFDLDACADLAGYNSQCDKFWSEHEDCRTQDWTNQSTYCNPPFNDIQAILKHFLHNWTLSPHDTSAIFILPLWAWSSWWHLKHHFTQIKTYPSGSPLFTSPD